MGFLLDMFEAEVARRQAARLDGPVVGADGVAPARRAQGPGGASPAARPARPVPPARRRVSGIDWSVPAGDRDAIDGDDDWS